jgi:hypothetical protein
VNRWSTSGMDAVVPSLNVIVTDAPVGTDPEK